MDKALFFKLKMGEGKNAINDWICVSWTW